MGRMFHTCFSVHLLKISRMFPDLTIMNQVYINVPQIPPAGSGVVAAIDKYTRTTEILWRKRDGMATL